RLGSETASKRTPLNWELYRLPRTSIKPQSWMPRSSLFIQLQAFLTKVDMPKIGALFDVRLGINAGYRKAFVLTAEELKGLPKRERSYFRAIAGNSTIRGGRLLRDEFIFYPYSESEVLFKTEEDLIKATPNY